LTIKLNELKEERLGWTTKAAKEKDWRMRRLYLQEESKIWNKCSNVEDKIKGIESEGISTTEHRALAKEAWDKFATIESERSLGARDYTKIGLSKALGGQYIKVSLTHFTSFMSNVKGCASLANKRELNHFEIITKEQYEEIIAKGKATYTTIFGGIETREVPLHVK